MGQQKPDAYIVPAWMLGAVIMIVVAVWGAAWYLFDFASKKELDTLRDLVAELSHDIEELQADVSALSDKNLSEQLVAVKSNVEVLVNRIPQDRLATIRDVLMLEKKMDEGHNTRPKREQVQNFAACIVRSVRLTRQLVMQFGGQMRTEDDIRAIVVEMATFNADLDGRKWRKSQRARSTPNAESPFALQDCEQSLRG